MGSGKKSKAPDPPNYQAIAQQQGDDSYKIAKDVTGWNRPNQYDALGNSLTWTQDKNGQWTQRINTTPGTKQNLQANLGISNTAQMYLADQLKRAQAQGQFDAAKFGTGVQGGPAFKVGVNQPKYDEASGKAVSDATYRSVMDRARPQQQRDMSALTTQLRQQGLQPGTEAYNRAMQNLMVSQGDVNTQAANQATLAGYDEARQRYLAQLQGSGQQYDQQLQGYLAQLQGNNQNFNQRLQANAQNFGQGLAGYNQKYQNAAAMAAIAGGGKQPTFSGFSGATGYNPADMLGAANAGYQAQMGGVNSGNAKKGSMMGSGLGFAGSMMGGK